MENVKDVTLEDTVSQKQNKGKIDIKHILMGCILISILALIYFFIIMPNVKYNNALELLALGNYNDANILLDEVKFKDIKFLKEEIKYESKVCEIIIDMKTWLKKPNSLEIHEINFYKTSDSDEVFDCVVKYGAHNGFGGTKVGYAVYYIEESTTTLSGTCSSLNNYDNTSLGEKIICSYINSIIGKEKCGRVNINRVKRLLENDNYKTVKIIK